MTAEEIRQKAYEEGKVNMSMKHIIITIALVGIMVLSLCACTPADKVNHNLTQEAN